MNINFQKHYHIFLIFFFYNIIIKSFDQVAEVLYNLFLLAF